MSGAERLLADVEAAPVQWLGLSDSTLSLVQICQQVECRADTGMVGAECFLCDRKGAHV